MSSDGAPRAKEMVAGMARRMAQVLVVAMALSPFAHGGDDERDHDGEEQRADEYEGSGVQTDSKPRRTPAVRGFDTSQARQDARSALEKPWSTSRADARARG